jgi:hypothetical protein
MRSDVEGKGKGSNLISMTSGETRWTPGGYSHTLTNTGHNAAKFISLEFR